MSNIKDFTRRHPLPVYFILVFIISTAAILMFVGFNGLPATDNQRMMVGMGMLFGPSIAGILLTGLVSGRAGYRELLSRLCKWRVGARWYAVALLTSPLSTGVVLFALSFFFPEYITSILPSNGLAALPLGIVIGLAVAFFEELGWTGFAIPQMRRRYSILSTGLILGFLWGLWHFLMFWERDSFTGAFPLALLLARLFSWLPAYRVLMIWVYGRTESLLVAMLMHMMLVVISVVFAPSQTGAALLASLLIQGVVLWIMFAVVTIVSSRNLKRAQPVKLSRAAS